MIGREMERRRVMAALAEGGSVVVVGAAGLGKSRLLSAVTEELTDRGHPVRHVLATASARDIPLGALAPFLPSAPRVRDGGAMATAREALLTGAPARLTLAIDDAHLLDGVSATVIHQVIHAGRATAVLATRDLSALPDAVATWVRADRTLHVPLGPLDPASTAALAEAELDGQVDTATAAELHRLTGGTPLVLRELLRLTLASGALTRRRGVWQLTGRVPADTGLAHLVSLRLDTLSPAHREALEAVTMAEPLQLHVLEHLAGHPVLEQLEALGLLVTGGEDGAETVRTAHPLYAELLASGLPGIRRRRLAKALIEAHGADPAPGTDAVRLALLRVTAGLPTDPGALLATAAAAVPHDRPLAERLMRAAIRSGGGVRATLALAQLLATQDSDETLRLLARLPEAELGPADRLAAAVARAMATALGAGRPADALAELGDVAGAPPPLQLAAAFAHLFAGEVGSVITITRPIHDDADLPSPLRQQAALCLVPALATSGRLDEAVRVADDAIRRARETATEGSYEVWVIAAGLLLALERRGDLAEALRRGQALLAETTSRADGRGRARLLQALARVDLLRGRPAAAARGLRETIALLRGADDTFLPWNLALLAFAEAACGNHDAATAALAAMDAAPHSAPVYHPEQELLRANVLAEAGDVPAARAAAQRAARQAERLGHAPVALLAWHALARYGEPQRAGAGARVAAAHVDGRFARLLLAQVEALAASDAAMLSEVADGFTALGAVALAADALAAAVTRLRRSGRIQRAVAVGEKLRETLRGCAPPAASALLVLAAGARLTPREREVAALAARGHTDRVIAAKLGISRRTVQTHLLHVYAKTGTVGRERLAELFGPAAEPLST